MTKLSSNVCVRRVRVRGGNSKFRALRLDHGNFSWGSEVGRDGCLLAWL
jgi:small subunit ribosomal protein S8e